MIEHKIGEIFTFTDEKLQNHTLITEEFHAGISCTGCFFDKSNILCHEHRHDIGNCNAVLRKDRKYTIFKEVK